MKISQFFARVIEKTEELPLSFWRGVSIVFMASFARGFLESFVNHDNYGKLTSFTDAFFHYPLWYSGIFLSFIIAITLITKEKIEKVSKVIASFSFIVILSPIVDLILSGNSARYFFISGSLKEVSSTFFGFFSGGVGSIPVVPFGLRIEIFLGILFSIFYVFLKTKNWKKALASFCLFYTIVFSFFIAPTIMFKTYNLFTGSEQVVNYKTVNTFFYQDEMFGARTGGRNVVSEKEEGKTIFFQKSQNQYSITVSICFAILDVALMAFWYFLFNRKNFITAVKNFRYIRQAHYAFMALFGVFLGVNLAGHSPIATLFDALSFGAMFLAFFFAFLFAVWENDKVDLEIDKLSNSERPLIKGGFPPDEWNSTKFLFLFFSLVFAFLGGWYLFNLVIMFILAYHIYSTYPLRLKRFAVVSSLVIGFNALLAVWAGFFMASGVENFLAFPARFSLGIFLVFSLAENVKNLKDTEGDAKDGIKTLTTIFGEKKGKLITAILASLAVILFPFFFMLNIHTFLLSVIFACIIFALVNRKNFREEPAFLAYFLYLVIFIYLMSKSL